MKILLFGKKGQVGWELHRALLTMGDLVASDRPELDLEHLDEVRRWVRRHEPDILVNAAAYTAVDRAEAEPEKAHRVNAEAVGLLAEEANRLNAWLVHYSTDYIFNGEKTAPYDEDDPADPLSVYGRTKFEGEERIRQRHAKHLIFRTSWVYAARGENFVKTILRLAKDKERLNVIADQQGAPTSAELIADVTALALHRIGQMEGATGVAGTYHLAAQGETSWHGFAQYILNVAKESGVSLKAGPDEVHPIPTEAYPLPARRPRNSRLSVSKLTSIFRVHLPDWRDHVRRVVQELADRGAR